MSFNHIKFDDSHVESYLFHRNSEGLAICSNCDEKGKIVTCNKCGDAICQDPQCSQLFPHYHNTIYAICNMCSENVSRKFKLITSEKKMVDKMVMVNMIDKDKLRLLKRKIQIMQIRKRKTDTY